MIRDTFYAFVSIHASDLFHLSAFIVVWLLPLIVGAWFFERKR